MRIILVLFLFTAASGQRHGDYSLTPVTVELDDIVMNILDELAPYVDESNCTLKLVKIFETLIQVDNGTNMFNIEIFCPDNQRSRVCTNVKVKKPTECIGKSCLIDPKEIECITILTGKNSSVFGNYSLTPVTIEIREVVLESLDQLTVIVNEQFELVNIFSAVAQATEDITSYMFDIEVYCPRPEVSIVCANVEVYQIHNEENKVVIKDPTKIKFFTIRTRQDNSAYDSYNIAPFTIGINKTLSEVGHQLSRAIYKPRCELEFVKVFEVLVQKGIRLGSDNLYMFDIEVYCPTNNVSKVCTNVTVQEYIYKDQMVRLIDPRGIQCYTIKTGKNSPVPDNYSLTPITIEIRKVVLDILGPLAPIVDEPELKLVDIFVAVAKVTPFVTEYMFDINVYCPSSNVSKVCVNVKAYESKVCIDHNITCPILYEPEGIQCFEISMEDHSIISQDSLILPPFRLIIPTVVLNDGSIHYYQERGRKENFEEEEEDPTSKYRLSNTK